MYRRYGLLVVGLVSLALLLPPSSAHAAGVVYVVPGGVGSQTGESWANAKDLQPALTGAVSGDQLWLKAGTYKPTTGTDRTASFALKNGVKVYGGFAGTETQLSQRNWITRVTVLSGEIGAAGLADNSYHVVTANVVNRSALLDGLTISAGNANGTGQARFGGGIFNYRSGPTLTNVILSGNFGIEGGGIANVTSSTPIMTNVIITGNQAQGGGGMYNQNSGNPSMTGGRITLNKAVNGGGILTGSSSPIYTNVTISQNTATLDGGGFYLVSSGYGPGYPQLRNLTISENKAGNNGGGGIAGEGLLTNVTVSGNQATNQGGGLWGGGGVWGTFTLRTGVISDNTASTGGGIYGAQLTLSNVMLRANSATVDGGGMAGSGTIRTGTIANNTAGQNGGGIAGTFDLTNVTLSENTAENGGGIHGNTTLTNVRLLDNEATGDGGGINGTGTYTTVTFTNNSAVNGGAIHGGGTLAKATLTGNSATNGAGLYSTSGSNLTSVTISGNTATADGGGVYNATTGNLVLNQTIINSNTAVNGGGVYNTSSPILTNATISGNTASGLGGGVYTTVGTPALTNIVISGNQASSGGGLYNLDGKPDLRNITLSGNRATTAGNGILTTKTAAPNPGPLVIRNSILWGNGGAPLVRTNGATVDVQNNDIEGGYSGANILNVDPRFITPVPATAPTTGGNLRLRPGSPVVQKGSNAWIPSGVMTDRDGGLRIINGTVDLGAYEQKIATVTTLTSSTNPSTVEQFVTFTARVTAASGNAPGIVTFKDGTEVIGEAFVAADGEATWTTAELSPGTHTIVASYRGDANYASSGRTLTQVVD